MLRHIVMFRLDETLSQENREKTQKEILGMLRALNYLQQHTDE